MIRQATPADAAAIAAIYAPMVRDTIISFEEEPPSAEEMAERIVASHLWLAAEEDGRVVGYVYAAPFHPRAAYRWATEVSIYLAPEAQGRGIGRELFGTLLGRLREMGFVQAFGPSASSRLRTGSASASSSARGTTSRGASSRSRSRWSHRRSRTAKWLWRRRPGPVLTRAVDW